MNYPTYQNVLDSEAHLTALAIAVISPSKSLTEGKAIEKISRSIEMSRQTFAFARSVALAIITKISTSRQELENDFRGYCCTTRRCAKIQIIYDKTLCQNSNIKKNIQEILVYSISYRMIYDISYNIIIYILFGKYMSKW